MINILRPVLELTVVIPGLLLAYLPLNSSLRYSVRKLFGWLLLPSLGLCIAGGFFCYHVRISSAPFLLILTTGAIAIYMISLPVSIWKSGSISLAVCAVFACLNSISRAINAVMISESNLYGHELWFQIPAGLLYNGFCWLFVLLAWYPATHSVRDMAEDENLAQTWYVFWILPLVFIVLNLFMVPRYKGTLYSGRILKGYIIISLTLLLILCLFYTMFLLIADSLNKNAKLQQENHLLNMQQTRYDNLCTAIEETRHARHDMRHHFHQLSAMAENGDLEGIREYLSLTGSRIPSLDMHFCENRAADSVAGYYCELAHRSGIPFQAQMDLPAKVPVDEIDMCLVLSNLLENALEASQKTSPSRRHIKITAYLYAEHLILIQVSNPYDGEIREKNGIFQSSKRKGNGIGLQSVRRICEKNGGADSFTYKDGIFTAKVMLHD